MGRWHHLGPLGSPEAKAEYARLIAVWSADPHRRGFAARVVGLLNDHHRATAVAEFGPAALAAWQKWLCGLVDERGKRRFSRSTVGIAVATVRRIWKWGVATERVPEERYRALCTVEGPKAGDARASRVVPAADPAAAKAVLGYLRPPVRAIVELMALSGGRPSEVSGIRPGDVLRAWVVELPEVGKVDLGKRKVWVYVPRGGHKTARFGKSRWLVFGPRAQKVLSPFLDRDPDAYCFRPAEATADLRREQKAERAARGGGSGGDRKPRAADPKRVPGERYTAGSLRNAVYRACERAGVGRFSPYQLRHAALSEIDLKHGLDAAQHVGGHSSPQVTRRYAKRSFEAAAKVALDQG